MDEKARLAGKNYSSLKYKLFFSLSIFIAVYIFFFAFFYTINLLPLTAWGRTVFASSPATHFIYKYTYSIPLSIFQPPIAFYTGPITQIHDKNYQGKYTYTVTTEIANIDFDTTPKISFTSLDGVSEILIVDDDSQLLESFQISPNIYKTSSKNLWQNITNIGIGDTVTINFVSSVLPQEYANRFQRNLYDLTSLPTIIDISLLE